MFTVLAERLASAGKECARLANSRNSINNSFMVIMVRIPPLVLWLSATADFLGRPRPRGFCCVNRNKLNQRGLFCIKSVVVSFSFSLDRFEPLLLNISEPALFKRHCIHCIAYNRTITEYLGGKGEERGYGESLNERLRQSACERMKGVLHWL